MGDKSARFPGLMASHTQHARMLQSLYRQSRNAQHGNIDMSNASNVSAMSFPCAAPQRGNSWDALGRTDDGGNFDLPEAQQLAGTLSLLPLLLCRLLLSRIQKSVG